MLQQASLVDLSMPQELIHVCDKLCCYVFRLIVCRCTIDSRDFVILYLKFDPGFSLDVNNVVKVIGEGLLVSSEFQI